MLKFIGAGVSWFPRGVTGRGTDRRANGLPNLYKQKLALLDARFHGTQANQTGPLARKLESFGRVKGLVVGPWGDCSKDMHSLIKVLGETKVAARARARGIFTFDLSTMMVKLSHLKVTATTFNTIFSTTWITYHSRSKCQH